MRDARGRTESPATPHTYLYLPRATRDVRDLLGSLLLANRARPIHLHAPRRALLLESGSPFVRISRSRWETPISL